MTPAAMRENREPPAPVVTAAEAERLGEHFVDVMDALVGMVQEETGLVRDGKLGDVSTLAERKAELTCLYVADTLRLRANRARIARIAPGLLQDLRRRHDEFRALLQINLTVLAAASAVAEGIVRAVSRKASRPTERVSVGHRLREALILLIRRVTQQAAQRFESPWPSRR